MTCEKFIYGGCGGNANQFDTQTQCNWKCRNPGEAEGSGGLLLLLLVLANGAIVGREAQRREVKCYSMSQYILAFRPASPAPFTTPPPDNEDGSVPLPWVSFILIYIYFQISANSLSLQVLVKLPSRGIITTPPLKGVTHLVTGAARAMRIGLKL